MIEISRPKCINQLFCQSPAMSQARRQGQKIHSARCLSRWPMFCSLVLYNSCKYRTLWLKFSFFLSYAILLQGPQYCLWRQTQICHSCSKQKGHYTVYKVLETTTLNSTVWTGQFIILVSKHGCIGPTLK